MPTEAKPGREDLRQKSRRQPSAPAALAAFAFDNGVKADGVILRGGNVLIGVQRVKPRRQTSGNARRGLRRI
ncbi:MAG: hypothetical protein ACOH2H_25965 [Cypionkella sp.]